VRSFGELEATIMDVLWQWAEPATVREVLRAISNERELAYTTVMTVMDNLHRKGFLRRELDGRAFRYEPTQQREEYAANLMREAMQEGHDPSLIFAHFVAKMSVEETEAMRKALRRRPRGASK
jgi:predicted transcriptional regulator